MDDRELGLLVTQVAVGMDTFERETSNGRGVLGDEGLVPLYLGKGLIEARAYGEWREIDRDIARIAEEVESLPDGPRRMFLSKLVESLRMASLLFQGGDAAFDEKLVRLVGVPAERLDDAFIDGLASDLDRDLAKVGYPSGTLAERIRSWESGKVVDPDKVPAVFGELMLEARDRTDAMVVPTDGYMMELNPVRDTIYTARCNFADRKMDLNVANTFTRTALKHLVSHECFPGHSTQNIYTLKSFKEGTATADVLLCSLNGITGVIQEGIGDQGMELINWVEDLDDQIQSTLTRYRSAIATQSAWRINMEGASDEEVASYLREDGAMQEARVRGRIAMAHHPFRAPFVASYFYGNEAVRRVRRATEGNPQKRNAFIRDLYGNMHSPESLCAAHGVEYKSYGDD